MALKVNPRLLLILAPRHPNRGDEIAQMLQSDRWRYNRRTAGELPDPEANVYLADTMGELGPVVSRRARSAWSAVRCNPSEDTTRSSPRRWAPPSCTGPT
jgi:hypothetical protein